MITIPLAGTYVFVVNVNVNKEGRPATTLLVATVAAVRLSG
jgi:hypothetical protein